MLERRVWIIDCETTGKDAEKDKVVEVGGVLLEGSRIIKTYESLVNPGIPIPPEASAIHHITDEDVKDAPGLDAALMPILEEQFDYSIAHRADFDSKFLDLGQVSWLCTWKLSILVWPEAPSHSNQVLRYYLKNPKPTSSLFPHRALYDAETTSGIFNRLLERSSTEDPYMGMHKVSSEPALLPKVGFGEHVGKRWSEVPLSYLSWMTRKSSGWDPDTLYTAQYWYDKKKAAA